MAPLPFRSPGAIAGHHPPPARSARVRIAVLAALLATLLGAPAFARPAVAQPERIPAPEVYRSEEFGHLFWWDPAEWEIVDQAVEPGSDWVRLSRGDTFVDVWAVDRPGMTAEDCVAARIAQLEADPAVARLDNLDRPGEPYAPAGYGDQFLVNLIVVFDDGKDRLTTAMAINCSALVPGERLLVTTEMILAEAYNERGSFETAALTSTLTRPATIWTFQPGAIIADRLAGPFNPPAQRVIGPDGETAGVLFAHADCGDFMFGSPGIVVAAEGMGVANFVVDPSAFIARDPVTGATFPPRSARWLWPDLPAAAAALGASEVAVLELDFPVALFDLYYDHGDGLPLRLAGKSACGGGGGRANPIVIDME